MNNTNNSFNVRDEKTKLSGINSIRDIELISAMQGELYRQKNSIESYLKNLKIALRSFNETEDPSIFVNCLYKALGSLTSTTKPIEKKALLNRVFKDFCVGK